jgi:hypothetical protein
MSVSVHDNVLLGFEVWAEGRKLILHTAFQDVSEGEPFEYTDVVFSGLMAYYFEHDNLSTILFDIEEVSLDSVLEQSRERFKAGQRYGWPGVWNRSEQACRAYLVGQGAYAYSVSSSLGLCGWVLAERMEFLPREALSR